MVKNLRLESHPYPHLRDDEGCVLAADFVDREKVRFIIEAANKAAKEKAKW